jgi:fatty acid synthase
LVQNKTFHGVLLDSFFDFEKIPALLRAQKKALGRLLTEGIKSGVVKPLHRTIFAKEKVEEAFRYMSTGKHIGKVVLQIRDENESQTKPLKVAAIPRTVIHPEKSVIITGGLGGFGLELAQWLAERGARKLVLTSRNGPQQPYHHYVINRLKRMGVDLKIWRGQGITENEITDCIKTASDMGPVGAIFHLAMIILDALMENQTIENFERSADTKITQCHLFDRLSRKMCPHLDYFVAFSSFVAGKGAKNFDFFKRFDSVFDFFKRFDLVFDFFKRFDSVFDFFKRFDLVFVYLSIK